MEYLFSNKISSLQPSAIREILKSTSDPKVIALAAGNPSPEVFPIEDVRRIVAQIMEDSPVEALQYGVTEGFAPLIEKVSEYLKEEKNVGTQADSMMITSGAQQVVDLTAKVLLNEGDTVICENPSFIGSLNCFRSYNAKLCGIPIDDDGMNMQCLENALKSEKNVKLIYTIPNFQNPTGITMSLEKRKSLYELGLKYNVLILEDNPYGETRVAGEDIPCIKSMDEAGIVIYAGSFSKVLAPGLRVAYAVAPKPIIAKMTVGKQASDVHTPVLNQMIVTRWMTQCDFHSHIQKIKNVYSQKLDLMCDLLDSELSGFLKYKKPQGGLFIWCALPENIDVMAFVNDAMKQNVAVVPGTAFLTDSNEKTQYIRLNFSTPTNDEIIKGMKILGSIAKKY